MTKTFKEEAEKILTSLVVAVIDTGAMSQISYHKKNALEALQQLHDAEVADAVRAELQNLYDYASNGTRDKTLLGNRLAALQTAKAKS